MEKSGQINVQDDDGLISHNQVIDRKRLGSKLFKCRKKHFLSESTKMKRIKSCEVHPKWNTAKLENVVIFSDDNLYKATKNKAYTGEELFQHLSISQERVHNPEHDLNYGV
ncbi:unnamed protein product [Lepeophtheirus salmonis]|uniref:(salmon louse) hypothetical protein n=1 Tax=Lepeophtheirus salmonis TaxID=72036 RepID=A0A7R8CEJ6_LEPSM|nr:unnamed protein product [Lepeophtheirus salmonis]CAF2757951.1 unnamed protein product [Lepeophtheirus salmonis]